MDYREWARKNGVLAITGVVTVAVTILVGSFVFDPPDHLEGVVLEKIYVPSHMSSSPTPYGGIKRGNYFITAVQDEQWIVVVRTDEGDTLTVHCRPDHHGAKNVGDRIHFREYQGSLIHIRYFSHGEEEDD